MVTILNIIPTVITVNYCVSDGKSNWLEVRVSGLLAYILSEPEPDIILFSKGNDFDV